MRRISCWRERCSTLGAAGDAVPAMGAGRGWALRQMAGGFNCLLCHLC